MHGLKKCTHKCLILKSVSCSFLASERNVSCTMLQNFVHVFTIELQSWTVGVSPNTVVQLVTCVSYLNCILQAPFTHIVNLILLLKVLHDDLIPLNYVIKLSLVNRPQAEVSARRQKFRGSSRENSATLTEQ